MASARTAPEPVQVLTSVCMHALMSEPMIRAETAKATCAAVWHDQQTVRKRRYSQRIGKQERITAYPKCTMVQSSLDIVITRWHLRRAGRRRRVAAAHPQRRREQRGERRGWLHLRRRWLGVRAPRDARPGRLLLPGGPCWHQKCRLETM